MVRFRSVLLLSLVTLVAVGCGGDDSVTIEDAWGRPSPMSAANAAFYMQITGGSEADTVVSASSSACGATELHETTMQDGVMSMQELSEGIAVPANETVSLEPGGMHVMCLDADTFEIGDMVAIDLEFAAAGTVSVEAEIREHDDASSDDMGDMGDEG